MKVQGKILPEGATDSIFAVSGKLDILKHVSPK